MVASHLAIHDDLKSSVRRLVTSRAFTSGACGLWLVLNLDTTCIAYLPIFDLCCAPALSQAVLESCLQASYQFCRSPWRLSWGPGLVRPSLRSLRERVKSRGKAKARLDSIGLGCAVRAVWAVDLKMPRRIRGLCWVTLFTFAKATAFSSSLSAMI